MIFPFLRGVLSPLIAPITWMLVAANFFVYLATLDDQFKSDRAVEAIVRDENFLATQGVVFARLIEINRADFSDLQVVTAERTLLGDREAERLMGTLALRSDRFIDQAERLPASGDGVAFKKWQEQFSKFQRLQEANPTTHWGLSLAKSEPVNWLTYQFMHGGLMHLFWNMLFLLIFGCLLEVAAGPLVVVMTYLATGFCGAALMVNLEGLSYQPLVGASAAVSGLMGVTLVFFWRNRLRFFYWWFMPGPEYIGFILLPAWVLIFTFSLPDVAGYIATLPELGSVAHTAHLGGTVCGLLLGWVYLRFVPVIAEDQTV